MVMVRIAEVTMVMLIMMAMMVVMMMMVMMTMMMMAMMTIMMMTMMDMILNKIEMVPRIWDIWAKTCAVLLPRPALANIDFSQIFKFFWAAWLLKHTFVLRISFFPVEYFQITC